jgi:hypothetical protein
VLNARHLPATLGTFLTCFDAFVHFADLLAIRRACLADFGAYPAKTMLKLRATELEISRRLADLGTVHQETEMFWFNVLSAGLEAVVHCGLQADLMALGTRLDTGLHGVFRGGVGW